MALTKICGVPATVVTYASQRASGAAAVSPITPDAAGINGTTERFPSRLSDIGPAGSEYNRRDPSRRTLEARWIVSLAIRGSATPVPSADRQKSDPSVPPACEV